MILGLFRRKTKVVKVQRTKKVKKVKRAKRALRPKAKKTKPKKVQKRVSRPLKKMPRIVGRVTHYFPHVKAGVILVSNEKIALGDTLQIKGHTTDVKQKVSSMQINNAPIKEAKPGDEVGLLVKSRLRHNDIVYKL